MDTQYAKEGLAQIEKRIEHCRAHPIEYKKYDGYFVSTARLDEIQQSLERLLDSMAENDTLDDKALPLLDEVQELRAKSAVAEASLAAAKEELFNSRKAFDKLKAEQDEIIVASSKAHDALLAEKAEIQASLATAQSENNERKKAAKTASKGFSPEEALKTEAAHKQASQEVQDIQSRLEGTNRRLKVMHEEKDRALKLVAQKENQLEEMSKTVAALHNARNLAMNDIPVRKVDVQINSTALKLLLGDKGVEWVRKAAQAHEADVRERVFSMVNALKGHKSNRVVNGLLGLLQVALDWLKKQSYKARLVLAEWVAMVETDIRQGTLRQLKHYREELEKVIGDMKVKAEAITHATREKFKEKRKSYFGFFAFFEEVNSWRRVLQHRALRYARGAVRGFAKRVNSLTSSVSRQYNAWFKANVGEDVSADYEPIVMFDTEDGPVNAGPGVPGPPPAPAGGVPPPPKMGGWSKPWVENAKD
ncbi:ORF2 [Plasmopara viticola lesion associated fusarivirus 2]|uniref:ORF2 n=1 Tax=Plasmopara viticola lesion associated fusarivirus 2 TaxID=2692088 RepID=A0AAE6S6X1_9VIRU|nr:ORF2 [Plasmopara viticola lesion associated fusarivirus 2]QHD64733.1 ORF2 [Plasmopara viticola lesion associated fusarivirus 2]